VSVQSSEEEIQKWHRRHAVAANNRAWELSEQAELGTAEKTELLLAANAAAYHWSKIGTKTQIALAEVLLGRTFAILGQGNLAMQFAASAFTYFSSHDCETWELAFAHAILAHAATVSGDAPLHRTHYEKAKGLGDLCGEQDKSLFLATFNLIPPP
jgi:hypothetical protein